MQRYRYSWLLASVLICMVVAPTAEGGGAASIALSAFLTLVVIAGVNTTTGNRVHLAIAVALGTLWLALAWWDTAVSSRAAKLASSIVLFALLWFWIYNMLIMLLRVRKTDGNVLSAAIAAYLLIGLAWAMSYDVVEAMFPGSYSRLDPGAPVWSEFLYFSLTTLTTLGYGDMTPQTSLAGIWASFEAVLGQLYIAVLIARLITLIRD